MGIGKITSKLGNAIGSIIANGQKAIKKAPSETLSPKETLSAMDALSQNAKAVVKPQIKSIEKVAPVASLEIIPARSLTMQLVEDTVRNAAYEKEILYGKDFKKVLSDSDVQEALNGAKAFKYVTGRSDIAKDAMESYFDFQNNGLIEKEIEAAKAEELANKTSELKARLQNRFSSQLEAKKKLKE